MLYLRHVPHLPYVTASWLLRVWVPTKVPRRKITCFPVRRWENAAQTAPGGRESVASRQRLLPKGHTGPQQINPSRTYKTQLLNPRLKGKIAVVVLGPWSQFLVWHLINQTSEFRFLLC